MRETAPLKAVRLLLTGRVRIEQVDARCVHARVDGDHATYDVDHDGRRWRCSCPTPLGQPCSHAIATAKVIHRETG